MGQFFAYSITVSLILTLAYGGYLLNRNGSAKLRRAILLGIYALALVITPALLKIDFTPITDNTIINADYPLPEVRISYEVKSITILDILLIIYLGGVLICTILTLVQLFRIFILLRGSTKQKIEGYTVYIHNRRDIAPFSIGKIMAVNTADIRNSAIIMHERTHIARYHSIDIFIAQLTAILCWYCPTVSYMRSELQLVHEFQADEAVIHNGTDAHAYCLTLIEYTARLKIKTIANSLSHDSLKQRIKMMQTPQTKSSGSKTRVLAPLAAVIFAAALLSVPTVSNAIGQISQSTILSRQTDTKGNEKVFVIYGLDINRDNIKNGNFKLISDFETGDINAKNVDGVILPRIGAIFCTDKKILNRLTPNIRKYIVDGKVMSAKEYAKVPESNLYKVIVSGNSMTVLTRNEQNYWYSDALKDAINAENK